MGKVTELVVSGSTVIVNAPATATRASLYVRGEDNVEVVAFDVMAGLITVSDGVPCFNCTPSVN